MRLQLWTPAPFVLSLSKDCFSSGCRAEKEGQGFDKLSPNGDVGGQGVNQ